MWVSHVLGRAIVVPPNSAHGIFNALLFTRGTDFAVWLGLGGAALLCELGMCQAVLLPITPGALEGVRVLKRRTSGLP